MQIRRKSRDLPEEEVSTQSTLAKAVNMALMLFDITGHGAVGVWLTNRFLMGVPETPGKAVWLLGNVFAWPLAGLLQTLLAGGHRRFALSLLRPFSASGMWRFLMTLVGFRWIIQEIYRHTHSRPPLPELLSSHAEDADLTEHVLRVEGKGRGIKGKLSRINEIYNLEITTHEVRINRLPPQFDGFTIVQLSDTHHLKHVPTEFMRCYVQRVLEMSPDMVALTGDYQTYTEDIEPVAKLLKPLGEWSQRERDGLGTIAVLGNHDREAGTSQVMDALRRARIKVLHNSSVCLKRNGAELYVAGVADPWGWQADLELALFGIPEGACIILLAHVPDFFLKAAGRVDLQLSGHNHGGQIKIPPFGAVLVSSRYSRRYVEGFFKQNGSIMFISRGLGGKPAIRWHSRPEITRLVLRSR